MNSEVAQQLVETTEEEATLPVTYERGVSLSKTLRATVSRFLPGALASTVVGVTLMSGELPIPTFESVLMLLTVAGIMCAGYASGLELVRRWLYPDARVEGRRSFVAGLLAPLVAFIAGVLGSPVVASNVLGFLFLPALIISLLMFFAWLSPTPEGMRTEERRIA